MSGRGRRTPIRSAVAAKAPRRRSPPCQAAVTSTRRQVAYKVTGPEYHAARERRANTPVKEYVPIAIVREQQIGTGNRTRYLVRWEGYTSDGDTWEPECNIHHTDVFKAYRMSRTSDSAVANDQVADEYSEPEPFTQNNSSHNKRRRRRLVNSESESEHEDAHEAQPVLAETRPIAPEWVQTFMQRVLAYHVDEQEHKQRTNPNATIASREASPRGRIEHRINRQRS
jgi:hypothetical protein